jgi:hypothetical protein
VPRLARRVCEAYDKRGEGNLRGLSQHTAKRQINRPAETLAILYAWTVDMQASVYRLRQRGVSRRGRKHAVESPARASKRPMPAAVGAVIPADKDGSFATRRAAFDQSLEHLGEQRHTARAIEGRWHSHRAAEWIVRTHGRLFCFPSQRASSARAVQIPPVPALSAR